MKNTSNTAKKGGHINIDPRRDNVTYEWNKPRLGAYERYLILACRDNLDIVNEITTLYNKLEACRVIIETVHHLVATNIIRIQREGGRNEFNSEIIKHNKQLNQISKEAKDLNGKLIKKLESIKNLSQRKNKQFK